MRKLIILIFCLFSKTVCDAQNYSPTSSIHTPQTLGFQQIEPVQGTNSTTKKTAFQNPRQHQALMNSGGVERPNTQSAINSSAQKRREIEQLIYEVHNNQRKYAIIDEHRAKADTDHFKRFDHALQRLNNMLEGKARLSVADAYYTIENAFGNSYLTREEYNRTIRASVEFIKTWMRQNKLSLTDNYMVHYAIQKFMSEPMTITKTIRTGDGAIITKPESHDPFRYDYNDYQGQKDYRNLFLTKCLATGFGQCSSMPAVYLVLAEGLGVRAYLSLAPNHSFIKYPDNSGYISNYEPTSGWEISDKWYKDNMFISAKAVENSIYLDTLNKKQIIANCIFDLAVEYMIVDQTGDESFILDCLKSGAKYFPRNNNLQALFIYSIHLKTMLCETMKKYNIASFPDVDKIPEAKKLYQAYMDNEAYITQLGYEDMPTGMYEEMLNQHEFKGKIQDQYNITGKDKRNLFTQIDQ